MSAQQTTTANIEVTIHHPRTIFFRMEVGTAVGKGGEFEMSTQMGSSHPIIRLPDGRWVTFGWEDLVSAAEEAGDK